MKTQFQVANFNGAYQWENTEYWAGSLFVPWFGHASAYISTRLSLQLPLQGGWQRQELVRRAWRLTIDDLRPQNHRRGEGCGRGSVAARNIWWGLE